MRASTQLQHDPRYAILMAFDVSIDRDARALADEYGVRIFTADIIYHLFDQFTAHMEETRRRLKEQNRARAVFPCRLRILADSIFNTRDPIIVGIEVLEGVLRPGAPLLACTGDPMKLVDIGAVARLEFNNREVPEARKGESVCVSIANVSGDAPRMLGRHFQDKDELVSRISRESIDVLKEHFRDEMQTDDWTLIVALKKLLEIV